jgi:hypothetical protein
MNIYANLESLLQYQGAGNCYNIGALSFKSYAELCLKAGVLYRSSSLQIPVFKATAV